MPSRRNFLKLFGAGLGAAAAPTAAAIALTPTKPAETTAAPEPPEPELHHPPKTGWTTLQLKDTESALITNTQTGETRTIHGPWIGTISHPEALVQPAPEPPRPDELPSIQDLIDQCARCQEHATNGDSFHGRETKHEAARSWQRIADKYADRIEYEANLLGYDTQWPGLYPEFIKQRPNASQMEQWHRHAQYALGTYAFNKDNIPARANRPNTGIQ